MKNRTIIGIVCMILAVAMTFAIAPVVNRLTSDTTTVVRLKQEVGRGTKITEDQVETVKVKTDTMPQGVYVKTADVVGKYASSTLYAGDILTKAKLSGDSNNADDVLATLNGSKVAVSVTIDTFAAGLSGKLQNGDIISLIAVDKNAGTSAIPGELKYVKVITTTMVALVVGNVPLLYLLNKDWFHTLLFTAPGKIVCGICGMVILITALFMIKFTKPIEYKR